VTALVGAICFLVGVLCGVVARDAQALYRQSRKERAMRTHRAPRFNIRTLLSILLGVAVAANLGCAALLIVTRAEQEQTRRELASYVECQARYQQESAIALKATLAANEPVSAAVEATFRGVAAGDADAVKAGVAQYLEAVDKRNEQRAKHPLPAFPDTVCGLSPKER
jgi:hypothetical protein